jgi:hypothetical protein
LRLAALRCRSCCSPLATIQYHSLSYRSSAAVYSLPKLCFLGPFRQPPPVLWKQSFKERAPKPELGCQSTPYRRLAALGRNSCRSLLTVKVARSAPQISLALREMAGVWKAVLAAATYILCVGGDAMAATEKDIVHPAPPKVLQ